MNLMAVLSMLQKSQNPMQVLSQLSTNNPQLQNLMQNLQGKSPIELRQYAENMAQAKGVNLNDYLKRFGISVN